jgi:hypothetical protein
MLTGWPGQRYHYIRLRRGSERCDEDVYTQLVECLCPLTGKGLRGILGGNLAKGDRIWIGR